MKPKKSMKFRLLLLPCSIFFIFLISSSSCKDKQITPEMKLTKIYVQSGSFGGDKINPLFISNKAFKASDKAIGLIDSTCTSPNGYIDAKNQVYVFENGSIPSVISSLSDYDLYNALTTASWTSDTPYTIPYLARLCKDALKFYFREAGSYPREQATVKTVKAYRFTNTFLTENYSKVPEQHLKLVGTNSTNSLSGNLFTISGLSSKDYKMASSRAGLVLTNANEIDFKQSSVTPSGTFDKITFTPISSVGRTYRLQVLYVKHSTTTIAQYFDANGNAKTEWTDYLMKQVLPKYHEHEILGYQCTGCGSRVAASSISEPPPPIMYNSY